MPLGDSKINIDKLENKNQLKSIKINYRNGILIQGRLIGEIKKSFEFYEEANKIKNANSYYDNNEQEKIFIENKSVFINFTFISSLLAYGGGGGGGGASSIPENKISFKTLKLCLKEKGYIKDASGMFELPYITCKEY